MNLDMGKHAIIRLFNVTKHYGGRPALQNVSMDILPGEFVFVSGPSGAGKSTLLKVLYLAETVSDGQILIDGMNLSRISAGRLPFLRRRFGMVFQDFKLIPTLTVFDNVALALEVAGKNRDSSKKKVMHVLRITGMEKARDLPPTLSGGEQQRVAVARAWWGPGHHSGGRTHRQPGSSLCKAGIGNSTGLPQERCHDSGGQPSPSAAPDRGNRT